MLQITVAPLQQAATDAAEEMVAVLTKNGKNAEAAAQENYDSAMLVLLSLGAAAIALLCTLGWLLMRSITRPLNQVVDVSRAVAG